MVLPILVTLLTVANLAFSYEVDTYEFLMPDVWPHRDELYLCTPIRISPKDNYYVVGFKPNATMHTAHHMLVYGCTEPGAHDSVWDCGEMSNEQYDYTYNTASPCHSGSQIVYAWARDAPNLQLPEDVGFLVGQDSPIQYLVLQIHYMSKFPVGVTDNSGVLLQYTKEPQRRQAGVILLLTGGVIGPKRIEHMETACMIEEDKVIHPFAFRTHTHALGRVVSGYVIRQTNEGDKWQLIGKKDPQMPQMFYPVEDETPIARGDILAARCTMENNNEKSVMIGIISANPVVPTQTLSVFPSSCNLGTFKARVNRLLLGELAPSSTTPERLGCDQNGTNSDEMCNFYLMYWVEDDTPLEKKYCSSSGPPYYYWSNAPENFDHIPEQDASVL